MIQEQSTLPILELSQHYCRLNILNSWDLERAITILLYHHRANKDALECTFTHSNSVVITERWKNRFSVKRVINVSNDSLW